MNKEVIIDVRPDEIEIALLEDDILVELHRQKNNTEFAVGDVYLGKVKKTMAGMNAVFVDIGHGRDAFLHYSDLGLQALTTFEFTKQALAGRTPLPSVPKMTLLPEVDKTGKISGFLPNNQFVMVQIAKEPISTKGPRITSEITIAGRYIILIPFIEKINVSQKIRSSEERKRLRRIIANVKPKNFGVIIRTIAENKTADDLETDLKQLLAKWDALVRRLPQAKPRKKLHSELGRSSTILRDILNASFENIIVNDQTLYDELHLYIQSIEPERIDILKLHKGRQPIFEVYGIDKQIKKSFGRTISIKGGIYLIIEQTEAMVVIDVNSGKKTKIPESQEENALEVNKEAASEIARQLRLRDMGGIIVIDFIDLRTAAARKTLYDHIHLKMREDTARHTILPISKFGLMEITRQRVRPATSIEVIEKCPACRGTGEIHPSILIIDELENSLTYLIHEQNEDKLVIHVHPMLYAYLKRGFFNQVFKWKWKFKRSIKIHPDKSLQLIEYHFYNEKGEEIKL
ncbi:MAG: Rne/Rng family ribonuclease [Bacteroidales bacterium]|nr:Rne/Rng family ribonuclease [Bacteroidales bacterium]